MYVSAYAFSCIYSLYRNCHGAINYVIIIVYDYYLKICLEVVRLRINFQSAQIFTLILKEKCEKVENTCVCVVTITVDSEGHKNCVFPCPARGSNPGSSDLNSDSLITTEPRPPIRWLSLAAACESFIDKLDTVNLIYTTSTFLMLG